MSNKKELKLDELEKVNGGEEETPTFSVAVNNIGGYLNCELYFTCTCLQGVRWFKALILDVNYTKIFNGTKEMIKVKILDGNHPSYTVNQILEISRENYKVYLNKN